MTHRMTKLLGAALAAASCLWFSGTASAARAASSRCPAFHPVQPNSPASQAAEAVDAEVVAVPTSATEDDPLVVEYAHGPAFWELGHRVQEDEVFFNLQARGPKKAGLHVRIDFPHGHINEADLFLYGENGQRVASSASFGLAGDYSDPGNGGVGYDYIPGYRASRCDGFTVESRALWGPGGESTLSVWYGPIGKNIPNEDGQD